MKVLALTLDYPPNRWIGSELATHALLKALQAAGHDVTVCTVAKGSPSVHDGVPVAPGKSRFLTTPADVVLTHVELVRFVRRKTCPIVGITHNTRQGVLDAVGDPCWSLVVHNAESSAAVCADARTAPYVVVHPPVDWRDWTVDRTGADAVTLVNVTGEKGSDTFYELAKRFPHKRFLGVEGGWGEPERKPLPNVELLPHGTDMRAVYAQTRVLLMPSEHESWGRVAVEAMSSGIPVIATDLPGPRECLGDAGVLIELDWWDEYERQLARLDDPAVYADLSAKATARARELDPAPQLEAFVAAVEALREPAWT